jgi:hypothetical protein
MQNSSIKGKAMKWLKIIGRGIALAIMAAALAVAGVASSDGKPANVVSGVCGGIAGLAFICHRQLVTK